MKLVVLKMTSQKSFIYVSSSEQLDSKEITLASAQMYEFSMAEPRDHVQELFDKQESRKGVPNHLAKHLSN